MPRLLLTDTNWSKLKPLMLEIGIYNRRSLCHTTEGILYRMRTGFPWRDIPKEFGNWNTIYRRFNEWSSKGILLNLFKKVIKDPDLEWEFIDSSIVRAHQHSSGVSHRKDSAIGKSRGGLTSKIHLAVDSFGFPIHFAVTGGEVHDCKMASSFIEKLPHSDYLIADKGYDSEPLREQIRRKHSIPVIPRRKRKICLRDHERIDWNLYNHRHLVENSFARLKHFRAIATRYDKLKRNYESLLSLACSFIWLPLLT